MNIVFDLGGVVLHWSPEDLINNYFPEKKDGKNIKDNFFAHPEWESLDRGTIEKEAAVKNAAERTGLEYSRIKEMLDSTPASLTPKEETIDLILKLKEKGHHLYILSNMHHDSMDYLDETHDFFELFEGKVASCRVNLVKPEAAIYQYLLTENNLIPEETIFIDDMKENVEAAAREGIHPIHFKSVSQCEEELRSLGCL
ncbi:MULTISPECIES: HAD family phosphatase [unclassified Oceanispirochaeta]|uniref:HAD family hydrolase n=1 Tax=unclassified Oceanispirochaeta TaxID=2635722 RepID=UPI000E09CC7B|nr:MULTISPECIES: HAD family phosphatase [unclassified Oceanispirochaeta]MBF9016321.1 HAD family phosphatase [Oceanispirochaeta sp. M2]NPD72784.1 HAD family phosphatase [Oceanispirochaeta sp. M1]RDG31628.1 HAD family phosphatase [Oceanispirochaeta sp. M1]